jgi:hypothetical protein
MAKKSKTTRQYNKQLQRQQKILRKAQQKGIKVDLSSAKSPQQKPTKKDITRIRKQNIQYDRQVKDKTSNQNKLSLTTKQIQKAVQSKQRRAFKLEQQKIGRFKEAKSKQEAEKQEAVDSLRRKLSKAKPQTVEAEPEPESYRPQEPTRPHPPEVNESTSFYTDSILRMYRQELKNFPNKAEPYITAWLDSLIAKYGRDDVAQMIQEGSASGVILTWEIAYDNSKLRNYVGEMLHYLPEMTPEMVSVILDEFDEWFDIR